MPARSARVAQIVVDVLTGPSHPWRFDTENVEMLARAGAHAPERVMEVIGRAILDRDRRAIFGIDVFAGLFEAIGLQAVRNWVAANGQDQLHWLAAAFPESRA